MNNKLKLIKIIKPMKMSFRYFFVLCISIATLASCSKGGSSPDPDPVITDQSAPTITITKPTAGQTFAAGSTIDFQVTFNDDLKLASYTVAISKLSVAGTILKNVPTSTPFTYSKAADIPGGVKTYSLPLTDIIIPANTTTTITTPGDYIVTVTCKDAAGKSATPQSVVIKIS